MTASDSPRVRRDGTSHVPERGAGGRRGFSGEEVQAQTTYSYRPGLRLLNALWLGVWIWLLASGVYFLTRYRLPTWGAWLAVGIVMSYLGFLGYVRGRRQVMLSQTFEVLDRGLRVTEWGKEIATVPWSEIRDVRADPRSGDLSIATGFTPRPMVVLSRLTGFDEFRAALLRRVAASSRTGGA